MGPTNIVFTFLLLVSLTAFGLSARRLVSYLQTGAREDRFDRPGSRLKRVLTVALFQSKLLREPLAGMIHCAIFWGFLALGFAVLESIGEGIAGHFSLRFVGRLYSAITFSQEIFCLLVGISVLVALWRRFVVPVKRLKFAGHNQRDAFVILVWILLIVSALLLQNSTRVALGVYTPGLPYPVSSFIAGVFRDSRSTSLLGGLFWWAHITLVLGFLNYLPYSKHLHVLTSIPNVYFSSQKPRGALKPIALDDESATTFGALDTDALTWKQLLDGYSCTECGRCDSVCPANLTGKKLSPRKIIVETRRRTMEKSPLLDGRAPGEDERALLEHRLVDHFISEEELWACTTCMACVAECPVTIEHVDEIVDLRRGLVLSESRFPQELRATFDNLERNFTPWGFSHSTRADWAEGLDVPRMAEHKEIEVLYWVGCAGAYDARYRKVARAFVQLLRHAGVKFAILGLEEKCTGDAARRTGNEYLAQSLMTENVATLNRYGVKNIVTTCPHCFNTLKNEFPQHGGRYEVFHHTDFLDRLVNEKKILPVRGGGSATFHDSCYLARYNGVAETPRRLLEALPETSLREMGRIKDRGLCCGAGGGRMWMEEKEGKRINIERTEEALATNAGTIATACPFCMTMLGDGVKAKEASDRVAVKDVAELLWESVEPYAV
ncbi:MAG TPA: (Fe-S)-binding protein [Bacteroidota bacterium]|nr:(Fe-S)-binding protein [Bacteroidota bacterium]